MTLPDTVRLISGSKLIEPPRHTPKFLLLTTLVFLSQELAPLHGMELYGKKLSFRTVTTEAKYYRMPMEEPGWLLEYLHEGVWMPPLLVWTETIKTDHRDEVRVYAKYAFSGDAIPVLLASLSVDFVWPQLGPFLNAIRNNLLDMLKTYAQQENYGKETRKLLHVTTAARSVKA